MLRWPKGTGRQPSRGAPAPGPWKALFRSLFGGIRIRRWPEVAAAPGAFRRAGKNKGTGPRWRSAARFFCAAGVADTAEYKKSLPFYHTAAWKRVRQAALMRDGGMCQACMERLRAGYGIRPNRATMVHHIKPVSERPDLALDLDNLRSLCAACHAAEHPEKGEKKKTPEEKYETKTRMRVIRV